MKSPFFTKEERQYLNRFNNNQDVIRDNNISAQGAKNAECFELIESAQGYIKDILNSSRTTTALEALSKDNNFTEKQKDDLIQAWQKGIKNQVTIYHKVDTKIEYSWFVLQDATTMENLVQTYTLQFVRRVHFLLQENCTVKNIIKQAPLVTYTHPKILQQLTKKYPDVPKSDIQQFCMGNPKDPEKAIQKMLENVEGLTKNYPDVPKSDIQRFCVNNPNDPKGAIQKMLENVEELTKKYPTVRKSDIQYFCVKNPKDPKEAIRKMIHVVEELSEKYPDVSKSDIQYFCVGNPKDPEGAIKKMLSALEELTKKYPDVSKWDIQYFCVHNPTNPEEALQQKYLNT